MGFRLTQRNLARAGCDYWDEVEIVRWPCVEAFLEAHADDLDCGLAKSPGDSVPLRPRFHFFTGSAKRLHTDVPYGQDDYLLFGRESSGIDPTILARFASRCVRIPMREGLRSLNLSNAVAIAVYEALRQKGFQDLK